jgi:hypothetical protein
VTLSAAPCEETGNGHCCSYEALATSDQSRLQFVPAAGHAARTDSAAARAGPAAQGRGSPPGRDAPLSLILFSFIIRPTLSRQPGASRAPRCAQMRSAAVAAGAGCQTKVQTPWPTAPATGARDDADRHNPTRPIFSNSPADAEVSLFFYAGHGLQVAGQNYLVSIDAKAETADTLDREMVCLALVQRTMERAASSNIKVLTPVAITLGAAIWLASWVRVCSRSTAAWQPWTLASAR